MAELTRTLQIGSIGKDVEGAKRTVYRGLDKRDGGSRLKIHMSRPITVRRTFGPFFASDVKALEKVTSGVAVDGKVTPRQFEVWEAKGYPDALALDLIDQYADEHKPAPPPPKLVEPKQGFDSLTRDLWPLYTQGRNAGLTDLGTYNPSSRLPSGRPSDHATSSVFGSIGQPACAFDLGFSPATGYAHPVARAFFHSMCGRPEVRYVILGNQIWSVDKGLHAYLYGGHENHVHVSGHRR